MSLRQYGASLLPFPLFTGVNGVEARVGDISRGLRFNAPSQSVSQPNVDNIILFVALGATLRQKASLDALSLS
jgi:hypothetical protein